MGALTAVWFHSLKKDKTSMKRDKLDEYYEKYYRIMEALERRIAAMPYDVEVHKHEPFMEVLKELDQASGFIKDILQAEKLDGSDDFMSMSWTSDLRPQPDHAWLVYTGTDFIPAHEYYNNED